MLSRRKVVVRRLNAIQNFGAMDVLCTDKTGTLTQDNIVLDRCLNSVGQPDARVAQLALLNSFYQSGAKNMMDRAILRLADAPHASERLQRYHKVDELPFDFERRRLSVLLADGAQHRLICKGAVDEMLAVATRVQCGERSLALDDARIAALQQQVSQLNAEGFRVLLIGERTLSQAHGLALTADAERDLTIVGLLTFFDPAKESAAAAIRALHQHGVSVKVLTGDNAIISAKICRDVGLQVDEALRGSDIDALDDASLAQAVERRTLFCQLTPRQKTRVVQALQQNRHTVGFLGDGINDAPALRCADIGISVDTATDIAKESADIILLEKSLLVLEEGVLLGRQTFGNIIKYLNMTASSNFGNVLSVLVASAFLPFLPMLAIQLLIQNLLYDISQMSLPWDGMDAEFLAQPRQWDAKNIGRFMLFMGPTSSLFDIATWGVMWFVFAANAPAHQSLFQSGWFIEGLLSQTLVVHMLRTRRIPFLQSCASWPVVIMTLLIVAVGIGIPFSPFAAAVGMVALPPAYFLWLVAILAGYCVVAQGAKQLYIRRFGQWF
jgi:Mg2+-importing ATPase